MSYINAVLRLNGLLGHSPVTFLLDSGATISVVRFNTLTADLRNKIMTTGLTAPIGANGSPLDMVGQVKIQVTIGNFHTEQVFTVVNTLTVDCLLGSDFLISQEVIIDYKKCTVVIRGNEIPFNMTNGIATTNHKICSRVVSASQTTTIPGRTIQLLTVSLPTEVKTMGFSSVLIEPQGPDKSPSHISVARTFSSVNSDSHAIIQVMNTNPTPVTIYQGTILGEFTLLSELLLVESHPPASPVANSPTLSDIDLSESALSPEQQQELLALLCDYSDLFATNNGALGRTSVVKHTIHTEGHPIRQPVRRQPRALQDDIDTEVEQMLQNGVIQPSSSPWSSPVVMVKKKDGSWRFCVDYRKLNSVTHRDAYPLPRIDSTLDSLAGSKLFTTLDLASGYWQVEMEPDDKQKTAFSTTKGHFEFNVMPFGLTNAPPTFQRLMECTLAGLSGTHCLVYLDDIIVFSTTFEDHLQRLVSVFDRLRTAGLKLKPKKCHFAKQQITYLGHVISIKGIEPDGNKLAAVTAYPTPRNSKEVKQFIGLSNYYRRFIPHYAEVAEPLHRILRKTSKNFNWTAECDISFSLLKAKLTSPPILAYPHFTDPFIVSTDASDKAIGGVLSQLRDGHERVIAYWSRQLSKAERNYSTIEREALAAVGAIKEFYPYLYGFPFTLITDHNPLTSLKGIKDTGGRLARWLLFLQQFNFTVEYKKGSRHSNADTLSRRPPDNPVVTMVEACTSLTDTESLAKAQMEDPQLTSLKLQLQSGTALRDCPTGLRKCFLLNGLICRTYKDSTTQLEHTQVVIPATLKNTVLQEVHNNLGHLGVKKTLERLKTRYYWSQYEQDTVQWVKQCEQCQKRNPPQPNPGAPLGIIAAVRPFEKLSWDIMGPLPISSHGNKYILVITDLFTKWVEAFPLKDATATTLATTILNEVICRYGVPSGLHSDQGANLCSSVIYSLCELLGIAPTRTSAYHPEGNGQVERFNRTLQSILAKTVDANQDTWDSQLPKALFAYRTAVHETTGFTPFHLTFARSPQLPVDVMLGRVLPATLRSYPQFVQDAHKQMATSCNIAQQHLRAQHLHNKKLHDKDTTAVPFCVGDRVWLYTPVVPKGKTKKFTSFWKGPYTIVDKTGEVNYKIQLIGGTQTFVVHRNRLKLCYTPPPNPNTGLSQPSLPSDSQCTLPTHYPASGVGGYTTLDSTPPNTRPVRNRRPPTRFTDYIRH